ncbi:MAG: hypothetical protein Q4E94_03245, partial [Clostridia bacterium]|nr:hypothetical protein [Clostridia bacterium]
MKRTKKQTVKQCLTGVLSGVMLMSTMPAAFAASGTSTDGFTFTQPTVVDCFYNFDGYSKAVGTSGTAENLPNGFNAYALEGLNYRTARLGSAATDGNTYLQFTGIGSHSGMKMKFDETIRTGKLLISFDMRIEDLSKFQGFKAIMNDTGTDDNNNVDNWWAGTYQSYSTLIDFAGGSVYVGNGNTDANKLGDISSSVGTTWHKYEMLIDLDADRLYAKIDSGEYKEVDFGASVKTLDFSTSEHKTDGVSDSTPLDMDNLCIKHFPDGAVSNYMTADYNAAGNDSNVFVAFSQCVDVVNSEPNAQSSDFKAVNIATGVEVLCDDVAIDGTSATYPGVKLTFRNMPAGTYKIVCAKPSKYSYPTDSNSFSTAGAVQNVESQSILAEDDFENYHGGMPANAVNGYLEKATTAATKADGKDGGSAMELSGSREQIIYRLPQSVTSGKLTYEFDVNHTNGLWFTGVLGAECFETDTISANTYGYSGDGVTAPNTAEPINTNYTAAKESGDWTAWNAAVRSDQYWLRRQTTAIGNYIKDGLGASVTNASVMGNISKSDGLNTNVSGGYQGVINDLSAPANQWNHVKVVVDLDASSYIVTVGNTTKTYRVYSTRFTPLTRYKKRMVDGVEKWVKTQEYGIEGISLGKFDDSTNYASTVKYVNFKVYT